MGSSFDISRIRASDFEEVVELGRQMHGESLYRTLDYSRECFLEHLQQYEDRPDTQFGVVARKDGVLCGFFMGNVSKYFFGRELIATEMLWYVSFEHRGSRLGLRLLRAFEDWAKLRGVSEVCIGLSSGVSADRTGLLLERLGYFHTGGIYKLPVVR